VAHVHLLLADVHLDVAEQPDLRRHEALVAELLSRHFKVFRSFPDGPRLTVWSWRRRASGGRT
jgi:hypothetical protein